MSLSPSKVARVLTVALAIAMLTGAPASARPPSWPQFRDGPEHRGHNRLETILDPAKVSNLEVAWSFHTPGHVI